MVSKKVIFTQPELAFLGLSVKSFIFRELQVDLVSHIEKIMSRSLVTSDY